MIYLAYFLGYIFLGVAILALLDPDNELYDWYMSAPRDWMKLIVLVLWPMVIIFYIRGRKRNEDNKKT